MRVFIRHHVLSLFCFVQIPLLLLESGCKKDKKKQATVESAQQGLPGRKVILTTADLQPGRLKSVASIQDFVSALKATSSVYANEPKSAESSDQCVKDLLYQGQIASKVGEIDFGASLDATSCIQTIFTKTQGNKFQIERATVDFSQRMLCESVDFSKFNAQKMTPAVETELKSILNGKNCMRYETLYQFKTAIVYSGTFESEGKTLALRATQRSIRFTGKPNLSPCTGTVTGGITRLDDGCIDVERSDINEQTVNGATFPSEGEKYVRLEPSGLQSPEDGVSVWHSSGKIAATFNTCSGTLTYSTPTVGPSYTLTCPGGLQSSGTLTAGLALQSETNFTPKFTINPIW